MAAPEHGPKLLLRTSKSQAQMGHRAGDDSLRPRRARESEKLMKKLLHQACLEHPLLGDGAMGTQLMLAGLEQGNCGEAWNVNEPEKVLAIQRRYAEAGSDCILTNTF